jgi:E3 ubiquitin-protein ligase RNF14
LTHTSQLSPQDPYAHYRHPGTSCFERLFDQEEIERFERETAMGVAGMGGMDGLPFVDGDEWREVRGIWEW